MRLSLLLKRNVLSAVNINKMDDCRYALNFRKFSFRNCMNTDDPNPWRCCSQTVCSNPSLVSPICSDYEDKVLKPIEWQKKSFPHFGAYVSHHEVQRHHTSVHGERNMDDILPCIYVGVS